MDGFSDEVLFFGEVEVVVSGPASASGEFDCRDSGVALAHDEVGEGGDFIDDGFFGDFEFESEEVVVASEVTNGSHACPADGCSALSSAECSAAGIGDDDTDVFSGGCFYLVTEFCGVSHGVFGEDDDVFSFDVAVVNACSNPDVSAGDFG